MLNRPNLMTAAGLPIRRGLEAPAAVRDRQAQLRLVAAQGHHGRVRAGVAADVEQQLAQAAEQRSAQALIRDLAVPLAFQAHPQPVLCFEFAGQPPQAGHEARSRGARED